MIPKNIIDQLSRLHSRENVLRLVWGVSRVMGIAFVFLCLACLTDWIVDRGQDTPWALRIVLLLTQVVVWGVAILFLLVLPLLRRYSTWELALWVEDRFPTLHHRLISAVQLNQPGADTRGMSKVLIAHVTREAVQQTAELPITRVADHRRLKWSAYCLAPIIVVAGVLVAVWPNLIGVLIARQFMADLDIPRSVALSDLTFPHAKPVGEPLQLRIAVEGKFTETDVGTVKIYRGGGEPSVVDLKFDSWRKKSSGKQAIFTANVPAHDTDFTFQAFLHDGRMRKHSHIEYVSRPAIDELTAWVLLPESCGFRSDGTRYEERQTDGEIQAIPNSGGRVQIKLAKPVQSAQIELMRNAPLNRIRLARHAIGMITAFTSPFLHGGSFTLLGMHQKEFAQKPPKIVAKRIQMTLASDRMSASGGFAIEPSYTDYQILVADKYGYVNTNRKPRPITHIKEVAPQVTFLPSYFWPKQIKGGEEILVKDPTHPDYAVETSMISHSSYLWIAYKCTGRYGVGTAQLRYRLVKPREGSDDPEVDEPFKTLPLDKANADFSKTGFFDPKRGCFFSSEAHDQLDFYTMPSPFLASRLGGGRFKIKPAKFTDQQDTPPKEGDQLEYYIEVFAGKPGDNRPSAKSQLRVTTLASPVAYGKWLAETKLNDARIQELSTAQHAVLEKKKK